MGPPEQAKAGAPSGSESHLRASQNFPACKMLAIPHRRFYLLTIHTRSWRLRAWKLLLWTVNCVLWTMNY